MKDNIIIVNPQDFEKKKEIFKKVSNDTIHIVSDFDRTLTKAFHNGKKMTAVIMQLYQGNYLSKDYREKAQALHDKYYSIEVDSNIKMDVKIKEMDEWWRTHKKLLIDSKLNINDVQRVVDEGYLEFRKDAVELFKLTKDKKIPFFVFSSSGLGEAIPLYFKKIKCLYNNIHIVTNSMNYDKDGYAVSIKEPIIHVFNKGEIALKGLPIRDKLKDRVNVILLGDGLGDIDMTKGFDYKNIIRIGFYNYGDDENLNDFKEKYDVLILNDGSMEFVNEMLKEILG